MNIDMYQNMSEKSLYKLCYHVKRTKTSKNFEFIVFLQFPEGRLRRQKAEGKRTTGRGKCMLPNTAVTVYNDKGKKNKRKSGEDRWKSKKTTIVSIKS